MLNPYAKYLGESDPQEVIAATAAKLAAALKQLGSEGVEKSLAPGKWNAREIATHLADCEIAFAFRLRQTLAEDNHVIQPFDQEKWAAGYSGYSADAALNTFTVLRQWNLALIQSLKSDVMSKPVTHPERGAMTFAMIVETMGGHDLNHLQQLDSLVTRFA